MEISKPYSQISLKFEKSQNNILNFRENMKNLKTLMQDSKLEFSKSLTLKAKEEEPELEEKIKTINSKISDLSRKN